MTWYCTWLSVGWGIRKHLIYGNRQQFWFCVNSYSMKYTIMKRLHISIHVNSLCDIVMYDPYISKSFKSWQYKHHNPSTDFTYVHNYKVAEVSQCNYYIQILDTNQKITGAKEEYWKVSGELKQNLLTTSAALKDWSVKFKWSLLWRMILTDLESNYPSMNLGNRPKI